MTEEERGSGRSPVAATDYNKRGHEGMWDERQWVMMEWELAMLKSK